MRNIDALIRRVVAFTDAAAAIFLIIITILTFTAVVMRYVLSLPFPGSFDVSRLLLGVAIFWGIAVGAYRREHISVDILYQVMPRGIQRAMNLLGDVIFAGFMGGFAWMLLRQVERVHASGQTTFELSIPIWPFHAVAWLGIVLCFVVLIARILREVFLGTDTPQEPSQS